MLTGRLSGGSLVTSRPRSRIRPPLGSSKPPIIRSVVVLPQPDGPRSEKNSPLPTSSETPSTARTSRNRFSRSRSWISGGVVTDGAVIAAEARPPPSPCSQSSRRTQRRGRVSSTGGVASAAPGHVGGWGATARPSRRAGGRRCRWARRRAASAAGRADSPDRPRCRCCGSPPAARRSRPLGHDRRLPPSGQFLEGTQDGERRVVENATLDQRQVDLDDVELDLAEEPKARVPGSDIVGRQPESGLPARRGIAAKPFEILDFLAFGELDHDLRGLDAAASEDRRHVARVE